MNLKSEPASKLIHFASTTDAKGEVFSFAEEPDR